MSIRSASYHSSLCSSRLNWRDTRFLPRYDVVSLLVYAVKAGDVSETIVNGRILMRDRQLLTLDEDALRREVRPIGAVSSIAWVADKDRRPRLRTTGL